MARLGHAADSGYPSDHATLLFALGFELRLRRPPLWPRLGVPILVLACAVGWARVFLGVHYPVDILGAAFVGFLASVLLCTGTGRAAADGLAGITDRMVRRLLSAIGVR